MKKIILILFIFSLSITKSFGIGLNEALIQAYNNNKELNAERENIKVSKEELKISRSEYLPSATITGSKSQENTNEITDRDGKDTIIEDVNPLTKSIKLEQTLIDFGRGAEYDKSKIGIILAEAKLLKKEQEILYKAAEAFTDLILANENLNNNLNNFKLLERQVETDQVRLERGQITISDLSQSESSLAGAQAQYIQAENDVVTKKLNYENVIGKISNNENLQKPLEIILEIPKSLTEAIELSKKNNPNIKIAKFELEQSKKDLKIAKSDLAPTATLSLERSYTEDLSTTIDEKEKDTIKATLSWPFYSGGKKRATINKNQSLLDRKKLLLDNAIKTNETNVASAWSNLQSSKSLLSSVKSQVRAAEIANEGISAEYDRGSRSTLDVIQSSTLLLNAKISLANSERNYVLSQYNLLKSVGLLNSSFLNIK
jgi:outer membrane protein|tara:strand:+ start:57 stop:1349 length:1293 start_codon:yes stop_codon:yes gene_type:complete